MGQGTLNYSSCFAAIYDTCGTVQALIVRRRFLCWITVLRVLDRTQLF